MVIRYHRPFRVITRTTLYWNESFRPIYMVGNHDWTLSTDCPLMTAGLLSVICTLSVVRWTYQMSVPCTTQSVPWSEHVSAPANLPPSLYPCMLVYITIRSIDYIHGLNVIARVHLHQIIYCIYWDPRLQLHYNRIHVIAKRVIASVQCNCYK